jgi:dipicolinate synthase subunit B
MKFKNINIGFGITGSFCNFSRVKPAIEALQNEGANVLPILSHNSQELDTRFYKADYFIKDIEKLTGNRIVSNIVEAEPIGPKGLIDIMVIFPCTGNTLAKLAHGIADGPVTMAAKSHLRNGRPVIIAVSTNDALGAAAENIGRLLARKKYYFVPFRQDDAENKPTSMVADFTRIPETLSAALEGKQLQPVLL